MTKYYGFWHLEDMKRSFESDCDNITDEEVLFASYGGKGYEGDAFILIQKGDKLYTVEASHCSCYGLENQWDMVETTKLCLKIRDYSYLEHYHDHLLEFLHEFLKDVEVPLDSWIDKDIATPSINDSTSIQVMVVQVLDEHGFIRDFISNYSDKKFHLASYGPTLYLDEFKWKYWRPYKNG